MNRIVEGAYTKLTALGFNVEGAVNLTQSILRGRRIDSVELSEIAALSFLGGIATGLLGLLLSGKNDRLESAVKIGLKGAAVTAIYTGYLALKD